MKYANGHFQGTILQVNLEMGISVLWRIGSPFMHIVINRDDHREYWNFFCAKTFVPLCWFIPVQLCWLGELSSHTAMMNNLGLVWFCIAEEKID